MVQSVEHCGQYPCLCQATESWEHFRATSLNSWTHLSPFVFRLWSYKQNKCETVRTLLLKVVSNSLKIPCHAQLIGWKLQFHWAGPLWRSRSRKGEERKGMSKNAPELNPPFGLDCVEERREVSNLRSRDVEWFRQGEQKFRFLSDLTSLWLIFTPSKNTSKKELRSACNIVSYSIIMDGF